MALKEKTPQERGLTASTDLRIARRLLQNADDQLSPACLRSELYAEEVPLLAPPAPAPAPGGNPWNVLVSGGSGAAPVPPPAPAMPGMYANSVPALTSRHQSQIKVSTLEFVLQQAWYGPYGEKEWHDVALTDLVPVAKK